LADTNELQSVRAARTSPFIEIAVKFKGAARECQVGLIFKYLSCPHDTQSIHFTFKMLFSTAKITLFFATVVVAVSAQSGVFFSAPSCAGTELQTVEFTDGLCRSPVALVEVDVLTFLSPRCTV
jgi:hypothetical protein